jgi:hypothetical protein
VLVALAACGGAAPAQPTPPDNPTPGRVLKPRNEEAPPVDPIVALATPDVVSYLVPGRVQVELGGTPIDGPGGTKPIEVSIFDQQGNLVRAAVRLPHAHFSVWTDRARLWSFISRDVLASRFDHTQKTYARLRAGAVVQRIKQEKERTRVRYNGAVEIEAWIPNEDLADRGPPRRRAHKFPRGGARPMHVFPGAVIRREPRWGSDELAVVINTYSLDILEEIDRVWAIVAYDDADVSVQGFLSRRDPPGRTHRLKDPEVAPQTITPTAKLPSGTCLYTHVKGEAVGYIVGDSDVALDDVGAGWWTVTIDTPWGPIPFAAQGPTKADLTPCAPPGSVPASTLNPSPPAPTP